MQWEGTKNKTWEVVLITCPKWPSVLIEPHYISFSRVSVVSLSLPAASLNL